MNKSNLAKIRQTLTAVAENSTKLKAYLAEIADASRRHQAEQVWLHLDTAIKKAREEMKAWRIGYRKGKHRIKDGQLEAIRQWYAAPRPKPKVRALAAALKVSPTTVYAVLKELGWRKRNR